MKAIVAYLVIVGALLAGALFFHKASPALLWAAMIATAIGCVFFVVRR